MTEPNWAEAAVAMATELWGYIDIAFGDRIRESVKPLVAKHIADIYMRHFEAVYAAGQRAAREERLAAVWPGPDESLIPRDRNASDFHAGIVWVKQKLQFVNVSDVECRVRNDCANIVIEATRIPDDAIRRGTGVRDDVVLLGERLADAILGAK